jgi:hypothetical protein
METKGSSNINKNEQVYIKNVNIKVHKTIINLRFEPPRVGNSLWCATGIPLLPLFRGNDGARERRDKFSVLTLGEPTMVIILMWYAILEKEFLVQNNVVDCM